MKDEFTQEERELIRRAQREKARAWRRANPEKAKMIQFRYLLKKAQKEAKNNE